MMNLSEILERLDYHLRHENYEAAEMWRDHLNDFIRWQKHRAAIVREERQDVPA
jgi:protein-arginine kinase activator protein McsA